MDYSVVGPGDRIITEDSKERQLDSVFTAKEAGEYRFCFNNEMSTFAEKMVDFEIAVRSAPLLLDSAGILGNRAVSTLPSCSVVVPIAHIILLRSRMKPPQQSSPRNKVPLQSRLPA